MEKKRSADGRIDSGRVSFVARFGPEGRHRVTRGASAIGGALLGLGWQFGAILAMLAVPATLAAIAILLAQRVRAGETSAQPTAAH